MDLYMRTVQPKREPMSFEVLLDGKPAGAIATVQAAEQEVATTFGTSHTGGKVKEEAVVQVSGVLDLPAGEHDLLFIHHNIVDGIWKSVEVIPAG